jgi:hypothetical protein
MADKTKPTWHEIARSALFALLRRRTLAREIPSDLRLRKDLCKQSPEFGSDVA